MECRTGAVEGRCGPEAGRAQPGEEQKTVRVGDIQLKPDDLPGGKRAEVGAVHLVGPGHENIGAGEFIILFLRGEMNRPLRHKSDFIGISVKMGRQGAAGLSHCVLAEHPDARNPKLLPGVDGAVS